MCRRLRRASSRALPQGRLSPTVDKEQAPFSTALCPARPTADSREYSPDLLSFQGNEALPYNTQVLAGLAVAHHYFPCSPLGRLFRQLFSHPLHSYIAQAVPIDTSPSLSLRQPTRPSVLPFFCLSSIVLHSPVRLYDPSVAVSSHWLLRNKVEAKA
jgi:hypothetical protein